MVLDLQFVPPEEWQPVHMLAVEEAEEDGQQISGGGILKCSSITN